MGFELMHIIAIVIAALVGVAAAFIVLKKKRRHSRNCAALRYQNGV